MAGIYLHIPFCKQACYYCDFYFSTSGKNRKEWLSALLDEIALQEDFFNNSTVTDKEVRSVYFGGGTPSLLEEAELVPVIEALHRYFNISGEAEVTLEANPDDIRSDKLQVWKRSGINRLSIGVQSFFDEDLRWMNRAHNASQALQSLVLAREYGFDNLSADLIYGAPGLDDSRWQYNVEQMIRLQVPHLSCYALTVEPHTALDHFIRQKKYLPVDPEKSASQFMQLVGWLEKAGYVHYEISNFAQPGQHSRHNSSYWQGAPYLGLGPSAHSFNGQDVRQWNIANNQLYIQSIRRKIVPFEQELLTPVMQLNEYIMTSLRTDKGCDLAIVAFRFGELQSQRLKKESLPFLESGNMVLENNCLRLTATGKLLADGIAAKLFA